MEGATEYPPINKAAHVVADAMMVAQYNLVVEPLSKLVAEKHLWTVIKVTEREKLLCQSTAGECKSASLNVIYELVTHNTDLFDVYILLHGIGMRKEQYHDVFLVRSQEGEWLVGSPANYRENWMTDLLKNRNLEEALIQLNSQGNYTWPSEEHIKTTVANGYRRPEITEARDTITMTVTRISAQPGGGYEIINQSHYIPKGWFFPNTSSMSQPG